MTMADHVKSANYLSDQRVKYLRSCAVVFRGGEFPPPIHPIFLPQIGRQKSDT